MSIVPRLVTRTAGCALTLLVAALFLTTSRTQAHHNEIITSFGVTNYTGYVLDSDALWGLDEYNRESILARAVVQYSTTNNTQTIYDYEIVFRLLDGVTPVPLLQTNGTTGTNFVLTSRQILPNIFTTAKTNIGTHVGALRPAVRLDPYKQYTVDVRLFEKTNGAVSFTYTGDIASDGPRTYRHFTNAVSGDAGFNVIPVINAGAFSQMYAIDTVPDKDAVTCNVSFTLFRYDQFFTGYVNPPSDDVPVTLEFQLRESVSGTLVPLTSSSTNIVVPVPKYAKEPSGFQVPAVVNAGQVIKLRPSPSSQLDPTKFYRATITIRHRETVGGPLLTGNSTTNSATRLLHFNGDLLFGSIATRFTSIDNIPGPFLVTAAGVNTFLGVNNQSGYLVSSPSHTYGDGTDLPVFLGLDGRATYTGANPVVVTGPNPGELNGIRFQRVNTRLDTNGALASFIVWFPTGFGARTTVDHINHLIGGQVGFADLRINPGLTPISNPSNAINAWGCEETKPFWFRFSSLTWDIPNGRFTFVPTGEIRYTRVDELNALRTAPVPASHRIKPSNEAHLSTVSQVLGSQVVVAADPATHSARMDINVEIAAGAALAHFPYNASLIWSNTTSIAISDDLITTGSSQLTGVGRVNVAYTRDCTEPDCAGGAGTDSLPFIAKEHTLYFTRDGGLTAKGNMQVDKEITWGWITSVGAYAHRVQPFQEAGFHMPGFFLRGDQSSQHPIMRAAVMLYTGIGTNTSTQVDFGRIERPLTYTYSNGTNGGFGDYAGLNFRVGFDGNKQAYSTLAAEPTGWYPLTGRSKYYVRKGGVNGIHEAVFGSFPETNKWYGYSFQVDNFGLAFLDSQNVDSRTEGSVYVKHPSDFTQNFEKLMFNCLGGLEDMQVPPGEVGDWKALAYWQADFVPLALSFERKGNQACDPGEGKLVIGVQMEAHPFENATMFGQLGFETNGNLITLDDNVLDAPFDSRLKLPSNLTFDGPAGEKWNFTPVNDAYLNNWQHRKNGNEPGWLNIAGKLDAPFFEDLKVHMHGSAKKDNTNATPYLMGGWHDVVAQNKGYEWKPGENFFNQNPSDKDNAGWPHTTGGANFKPTDYRKGNVENGQWLVRAQRLWLDIVQFDYPLYWDTAARSFRSAKEVHNEMLVLDIKHQIKYLSPEITDITFGAEYKGMPTLNIANLAYDQLGGLQDAVEGVIGDEIKKGMNAFTDTLSSEARKLFKPAFDEILRPQMANLVAALHDAYELNPWDDINDAVGTIGNYCTNGVNSIAGRIRNLADFPGGQEVFDLVKTIDDNLVKVEDALNDVHGILDDSGGNRQIVKQLMEAIVGSGAPDFLSALLDDKVNELLKEADPTLDQLLEVTHALQDAIGQARSLLAEAVQFKQQLIDTFNGQVNAINGLVGKTQKDIEDVLKQFDFGPNDNPFDHYTEQQLTDLFMQKLEDRFFGSIVSSKIREVIRQQLYDLEASIRQSIDSVFQQVNVVVRDIISETAQQLSNEINGMLGDLNSICGAGKINGYAHINGDSLKELRVDVYASLKIPSDMEFHGFLLIRELDSENFPTDCLPAGGKATEVTLGADKIPVKFANCDANLAATAKFTFDSSNGYLQGFAGGIDLDGKITLGPATIKKLSAAMAFGAEENYFSAACRVAVNSYEGMGGLYFGRTCTLEPFSWDPLIQKVIGEPPFTGAYTYVEVWIPVSEALLGIPATCMFQVSAGMGMGAGFFVEGPTFLGKVKLGVSGDFLCVASIYGDIVLAGKGSPSGINMIGSGTFEVEICVLICVSASKTVEVQYSNGSWDIDF